MAWKQWNPNPKGLLVGDCVIRALCAITGKRWVDVHKDLSDLSRDMGDLPNADKVWWRYAQWYGFNQKILLDSCPDCYTVSDFANDHPNGVYLLGPTDHAVAVIYGNWYDTWDSGLTVPTYYFRRL